MCDRQRSCSIIKDSGLSAAFTVAHELGHVSVTYDLSRDATELHARGKNRKGQSPLSLISFPFSLNFRLSENLFQNTNFWPKIARSGKFMS